MASWKKVIVSGSQAELAGITGSLLTDERLLFAQNGGAISSTSVSVTSQGHLNGTFSGSFDLELLEDGNGIADFSYDGNGAATVTVEADSTTGGNIQPANVTANGVGLDIAAIAGTGLEADGSANLRIQDGGIANTKLETPDIRFSGSGISTDASVALGATASIDVNVDDVTIEISGDQLQVKAGGLTTASLSPDSIVHEAEGIGSNDNETGLPTAAAVKDYVDAQVAGGTLTVSGSGDTSNTVDLATEDLIFAGQDGLHISASAGAGDVTFTVGVNAASIANDRLANDSVHISGSGISAASVALGATASIDVQVDGTTIEIDGDSLQLVNDSIKIGDASFALGTTASLADTKFNSGSFSGSFQGDGSQLTGIPTTLTVDTQTDSSVTADVDLLTDDLQIIGTTAEVDAVVTKVGTDVRVQIGLPDDVTIANNLTVTNDLTVLGDTTTLSTTNLLVEDAFILVASGSTGNVDGGIIVDGGDDNGEGFVYDTSATNGIASHDAGRWGFQQDMSDGANASAPNAFASAVVIGTDNTVPANTNRYSAKGNIFIANNEDIYIWS